MTLNLTRWIPFNDTFVVFDWNGSHTDWNRSRDFDFRHGSNMSTTAAPDDDDAGPLYGPIPFIALAVVLTAVALITTVSNLLIIVAFVWNKKLRKLTNYFYVSLAISDFIAGLFDMAPGIWEALMGYENWKFGKITCVTWLVVDYWIYTASTYTMLAICVDRYFAILHGLRYRRRRTHRLVMTMIVSCWALAFVAEVPGIVVWEYIVGESIIDYTYYCDVEWSENETYAMVNTMITMLIPFVFILFLSCAIWVVLRRRARSLRRDADSGAVSLKTGPTNASKGGSDGQKKAGRPKKLANQSIILVPTISYADSENNPVKRGEEDRTKLGVSGEDSGYQGDREERYMYVDAASQTSLSFSDLGWKTDGDGNLDSKTTCDKSVWTSDIGEEALIENSPGRSGNHGDDAGVDNPAFIIEASSGPSPDTIVKSDRQQSEENVGSQLPKEDRGTPKRGGGDRAADTDEKKSSVSPTREDSTVVKKVRTGQGSQERKMAVLSPQEKEFETLRRLNTTKTTPLSVAAGRTNANISRLAGDRRAVMSFAILMGTFLILWTPWFVIAVIESVCSETCVMGDGIYYVSAWLIYLNSMINPFIYVFRDAEFKRSVSAIICCLCCCRADWNAKSTTAASHRSRDRK